MILKACCSKTQALHFLILRTHISLPSVWGLDSPGHKGTWHRIGIPGSQGGFCSEAELPGNSTTRRQLSPGLRLRSAGRNQEARVGPLLAGAQLQGSGASWSGPGPNPRHPRASRLVLAKPMPAYFGLHDRESA